MVITEGPTDVRVLSRAFPDQNLAYFPASTRSLALEAAKQLGQWRLGDFACVVDRDFDHEVEAAEREESSIHAYENADMEAMLAVSKAGIDLLLELGSADKIERLGGAQSVIDRLSKIIEPITRLRRANIENAWGLAFDQVDLGNKIDRKLMTLKLRPYCAALVEKTDDAPNVSVLVDYASGARVLDREPQCPKGSKPYFRGRDFLAILSVALCGFCGSKRSQSVTAENLEGPLRLAGAYEIRISPWGEELLEILAVEKRAP
ncbi:MULTISPECIES: hypothetical protein [Streptomyces]|uniref:hypothetical protein n=1 Tax=Streptomyces TaxID=1883 RepID=UPI000FFF3F27|nr:MULTISPECIES: hypothetical protein [Streptomyces]